MNFIQKLNQNSKYYLLLIIFFSVLLRIGTAFFLGNNIINLPGIADQISYNTLAIRFIQGHGFTFDRLWWPITRANQPTAHWSYLYTLYLAAVYSFFGVKPAIARLIQAVAGGILMPYFAYRISRSVFKSKIIDPTLHVTNDPDSKSNSLGLIIPLVSALWVALYGYFIYYAAALVTETFYIIGIFWCLDCALRIRFQARKTLPRVSKIYFIKWIELGISIGFTVLLRQVFLLFLPFLFFWFIFDNYRLIKTNQALTKIDYKKLIYGGVISVIIIMLLVLPITIFNYNQFQRFVLLNTNSGYAFFWANHPIHKEHFIPIFTPEMLSYQHLIPAHLTELDEAALDQELLKLGLGFVSQEPIRYIKLSLSRIPVYFEFWPKATSSIPSNITRVLSFGIAFPFMIIGILYWGIKTKQDYYFLSPGVLLLIFMIIYSLIHLLSWALIRYRLPVDAVGLIFAAQGIVGLYQKFFLKRTSA